MCELYCTECKYFQDVIDNDREWFGALCTKDGHDVAPSMYAIKSLHNRCPFKSDDEDEPSVSNKLNESELLEAIHNLEKRVESLEKNTAQIGDIMHMESKIYDGLWKVMDVHFTNKTSGKKEEEVK